MAACFAFPSISGPIAGLPAKGRISSVTSRKRIGEGAQIQLNMARVMDGLWMPERIDIDGTARVLMVHNKVLDEHVTFSGYHPYGAATGTAQRAGR